MCRYVSAHLPRTRTVIIESDNARNYNKNLLSVFAPIVCDQYGIFLGRIVHNETQDRKGPADVHFASAMKHVNRYVEKNELNFVKSRDPVRALNHGEGMHGCIAELFDLDQKCEEATA